LGELTNEATLNAPAEKVFQFVADPHNAPGYISSIKRIISGPGGPPAVGQTWQVEANFLGRPANLTLHLARLVPNRLVAFTLEGEPQATMSLHLDGGDNPNQTRVSLTLEVPSVPSMLLSAFMGSLLAGDLGRLKSKIEN
jgi:uncharacterized protein YndB with AHSA1/START domain